MNTINSNSNLRLPAIDIFRALTMLFMIFVNDLWSLHDIPIWLEHKPADFDGMGFADCIFPIFLFIVGLSIPLAISGRIQKGESIAVILRHITIRSIALLIMGFFHVNFENMNSGLMPVSRGLWEIAMTISFFLIWNVYKDNKAFKKIPAMYLQIAGIIILAGLAFIYRAGTVDAPVGMKPHWWGILGLIGWSYFICSVIYLFLRNKPFLLSLAGLVFLLLNMQEFYPLGKSPFQLIISASGHTLVMCGILCTLLYQQLAKREKILQSVFLFFGIAVLMLLAGFLLRPLWGISKIRATPSWVLICAAISFSVLAILLYVTVYLKKTNWANLISPAGRSTLTCYLLPYFIYPLAGFTGIVLPSFISGGVVGLIKSFIFAVLIIYATGLLEKLKIRLKI